MQSTPTVIIDDKPLVTMDAQSDVYVVKFNTDGKYIMSGHTDRTVKVIKIIANIVYVALELNQRDPD